MNKIINFVVGAFWLVFIIGITRYSSPILGMILAYLIGYHVKDLKSEVYE